MTDQLLATVADRLAVISWQLSGDKRAPRPKPVPRPGVVDDTKRYGRTALTRAESIAFLRQFSPVKGGDDGRN